MPEYLQTFAVGVVVSIIFVSLKLDVPVTPTFAGLMGIVGLFVGFALASKYIVT